MANQNAIVMVDDNDGDLVLVEEALMESSLSNPWLPFTSGKAFLAHLERVKAGEHPMPALVLLDINMPVMNGLDVLKAVRRDPAFTDLPIVTMLTSSTDPLDREFAERHGSNGFVVKPNDILEYVEFFDSLEQP